MVIGDTRAPRPSDTITAVGVDHVRLSYLYADEGDRDGLASLLHANVQVRRPDAPPGRGRAAVLEVLAPHTGAPGKHHVHRVIADGDCIATVGRYTAAGADVGGGLEFADFFTIADDGLLLDCRRFYYVAPGRGFGMPNE